MKLPLRSLLVFLMMSVLLRADVNILIIGSDTPGDQQYASRLSGSPDPTPAFQYEAMADHLRQILDGAGLGTVNVTTRNRAAGSTSTSSFATACNNLASWFYWPYGEWVGNDPELGNYASVTGTDAARWAELSGQNETIWDYVVLIGDPYTIETIPGYYTLGVAKIAEEVAKGPGETVLLMPWPAAGSSSTLDHYKEVVYRTGRTAGIPVAPAGLAWQAAGSPTGATHPSADGAYIAAATLYSRLFNESATNSSYSPQPTLATAAHNTVTANQGAPQYSGPFVFNNPLKMLGDMRRDVYHTERGTSTESRLQRWLDMDILPDLKVNSTDADNNYNSNTPDDDGLGWRSAWPMPASFNYGRHQASASDGSTKSYFTNRDFWQLGFGFAYHATDDRDTYIGQMSTRDLSLAYLMKEGTTSFFSYNLSAYDQQEEIASARLVPTHTLYAIINREYPDQNPKADQSHMNRGTGRASATLMYTLYSGRAPIEEELAATADPSWITDLEYNNYVQYVGYETAWILGKVQARAPGFKVTPSSTNTSAASEIMSVRFLFPPQEDVTVNVSVSDPSLAEVSREAIVFTPENYSDPVELSVRALDREDGSNQTYDVQFSTTSDDEVFDGLNDAWSFEMPSNAAPGVTITSPADGVVLPNGDLSVTADASDPDGTVASVTLRINGLLVRQDSAAPYQWSVGDGDSLLANLADDFYELELTAIDNQGESYTVSRTVTVGSPSTVPPAAPQGFSGVVDFGATSSSIRLDWDDNSEGDFQSYSVYRSTSEGDHDQPLAGELTSSNFIDTDIENGTTYFYVVTAVDIFGNESAWSTEIAVTPQLGPGLTVFGLNNDGFGGFTTSAATGTEVWTDATDSVHYAFGVLATDEAHTASLLKSYSLDRTIGSTYTIEGVVDLTDGYGDTNNRMGILLFNNNATQTGDGGGGLYLRLNADGANLAINDGINNSNGNTFAGVSKNASGSYSGDSWIGTRITFKADIEFANVGGVDKIILGFVFTDQNGETDTLEAQVNAADYPGTYFGFASKWRQKGDPGSNQNVPPAFDYRSFLVLDTLPPAAPGGLSAVANDGSITLDWDDNGESDLSGYAVWRGTASGDYGPTPFAEGLTASAYTDTSPVSGSTYFYAVTARDLSANESGFSNEASALYTSDDSELDSDGDGLSDADEVLAGSDPNDAESTFRLVTVAPQSGGTIAFQVPVNPDSYYRIYYRDSLAADDWQVLSGYENITPASSPMTIEDASGGEARFYKIAVQASAWPSI